MKPTKNHEASAHWTTRRMGWPDKHYSVLKDMRCVGAAAGKYRTPRNSPNR